MLRFTRLFPAMLRWVLVGTCAFPAAGLGAAPPDPPTKELAPPTIGAPGKPFSNTCDGTAIGFFTPAGARPRMELTAVPPGAVLECRSGSVNRLSALPFTACDGRSGTTRSHVPVFDAQGAHRTEARYKVGNRTSAVAAADYYVHRSLDRVQCCDGKVPDSQWFAAARAQLPAEQPFDNRSQLLNPFVEIHAGGTLKVRSLRRTFRLSADRRLLLVRRALVSRTEKTQACAGVIIHFPTYKYGTENRPVCEPPKMSKFMGGLVEADCPATYCTVSECEYDSDGCALVTHTFNRGPGQQPWVVRQAKRCPSRTAMQFQAYQCDAYVLDAQGNAACLVASHGVISVAKLILDSGSRLGLAVLGPQASDAAGDRYVFSAKTKSPRAAPHVLHLPQ